MMQDPMANLTGDNIDPSSSETIGGTTTKIAIDPITMNENMKRIDRIRSVMGIVSGCVSGICGMTGLQGLFCFIFLHVLVCIMIWVWKMNFNLDAYTKSSWFNYLTMNIQPTALSFTLFWTLFYGLVYLY